MAKYNKDQLKEMAKTLIRAKVTNDFRYFDFILTLSLASGVTVRFIEQKIQEYAGA